MAYVGGCAGAVLMGRLLSLEGLPTDPAALSTTKADVVPQYRAGCEFLRLEVPLSGFPLRNFSLDFRTQSPECSILRN